MGFRALLDADLVKTTIGNRRFGVLKGALDGGLDSDKRFAGFKKDEKSLNVDDHRRYIPKPPLHKKTLVCCKERKLDCRAWI